EARVMPFGAAEHRHRAEGGPREAQPGPPGVAVAGARELGEIDTGGDGHGALWPYPPLDDKAPKGLAARDHTVGEPAVDRVQPAADTDGDGPGPGHREGGKPRRAPPPPTGPPAIPW